jgi:hypothetical protein
VTPTQEVNYQIQLEDWPTLTSENYYSRLGLNILGMAKDREKGFQKAIRKEIYDDF